MRGTPTTGVLLHWVIIYVRMLNDNDTQQDSQSWVSLTSGDPAFQAFSSQRLHFYFFFFFCIFIFYFILFLFIYLFIFF